MIRNLMMSAALLALVGFTPPTTLSAPQGKGGGGGRGGGNPGGNHSSFYGNSGYNSGRGYYPGHSGGYPGYYHPGYGYGYGYGYPWGSIGLGYALGRGSGYGGYGVGSYSSPYYYMPSEYSTSQYGSVPVDNQPPLGDAATTQARITVLLPADAKLWIGEYVSTLTGPSRVLVTPVLDPNMKYSYTLSAKWNENGREVSRTREVKFLAGDTFTVNMTESEPILATPKPTVPQPKPAVPQPNAATSPVPPSFQ